MPVTNSPTNIRLQKTTGGVNLLADVPSNVRIEVENLSATAQPAAVFTGISNGKLRGAVPGVQEGDFLKLTTKDAQGHVLNWLTVRAQNIGTDARAAKVNAGNLALQYLGDRKVTLAPDVVISEPRAMVQVKNLRTGDVGSVKLDGLGRMPGGFSVKGLPGDEFSIALSDGKNNANFSTEAARLRLEGTITPAQIAEPKPHPERIEAGPDGTMAVKRFPAPLVVDGMGAKDVRQGSLGDCYLCSAAAALAHAAPDALRKAIVENGDGSYDVTFKTYDAASRTFKSTTVTVDGDLYVRNNGMPIYGKGESTDAASMETWFPIFEKAYATYKGGYDVVGNGGSSAVVMGEVLGMHAVVKPIASDTEGAWTTLKTAVDQQKPTVATTYGSSEAARYTNSGVYANHAYTVLGYAEENGQRFVQLRNPWGRSEPGDDGANDGIFKMKFEDFTRLYKNVHTVR